MVRLSDSNIHGSYLYFLDNIFACSFIFHMHELSEHELRFHAVSFSNSLWFSVDIMVFKFYYYYFYCDCYYYYYYYIFLSIYEEWTTKNDRHWSSWAVSQTRYYLLDEWFILRASVHFSHLFCSLCSFPSFVPYPQLAALILFQVRAYKRTR